MAYIVNICLIKVIATIKANRNGSIRHYQSHLGLVFLKLPPNEMLEKVELVINSAFQNPKTLRYRDFYSLNTDF
jgi:hypothetical protein